MDVILSQAMREYERELAETPNYPDGGVRPTWHDLPAIARWQRQRNTPFYGHARCPECGMGEKQGHVATCSKVQRWTPQTARQRVGGTFGS